MLYFLYASTCLLVKSWALTELSCAILAYCCALFENICRFCDVELVKSVADVVIRLFCTALLTSFFIKTADIPELTTFTAKATEAPLVGSEKAADKVGLT